MSAYDEDLPSTINTFLRDGAYVSRVHIRPGKEEFHVPPHCHEKHDELFHVVQGRLEVLIGTEIRNCEPKDGEICIPKGVIDSLRVYKGEETIFEEKMDPLDDGKEIFFRNILEGGMMNKGFFEVMQIMFYGDMRPVLPLHIKWVDATLVNVVGYYLASWLGYKLRVSSLKKAL
ncbi:hypothetical protein BDN70DRAFT_898652 [Pholiota conissans]|uniref:Uncharacterized protein n=1 Tax=Pholiota conissans TaxID=109636 RepID=A0A9P6CVJ9_9AGAR|nr:hypothetical protein BDN70DRAFT_898652 [Pholiota conissans]